MSMEYIRKHYGVPAKRGGKVRFAPYGNRYLACEGVIVGSRGAHLKIRMGDEKRAGIYHPTCDLEYL
jgi:hypothetical protein